MEYGFVESFTLSGKVGEAWKISSNWRGRQKTVEALTGSLSLTALEEILFGNTSVFIDAAGGTIGSTQKAGVLLEASVTVNTGIMPVFTADGGAHIHGAQNHAAKPGLYAHNGIGGRRHCGSGTGVLALAGASSDSPLCHRHRQQGAGYQSRR
jgi:hypothetical protein